MKNTWRRFVAFVLCLTLCTAAVLPITAANESNTLGVVFGVSLDKPTLTVSDTAQTVVMTLSANQAITLDGFGFTVTQDSPLTLTSIAGNGDTITIGAADVNLANGKAGWGSADGENVSGVTTLAVITFTVPANTPAGTYSVGVDSIIATKDYTMDEWENGASAATTLTITNAAAASYTAGITASAAEIAVGETVYFDIAVNQAFAAAELAVSYPSALLTFNETASVLNGAAVTVNGDTLTIVDHGETQSAGTAYKLAFSAASDGAATVTLTDAAFSERDSAKTEDLTVASVSPAEASITVKKASHTVQLPEILTGNTTVEDGADYTFAVTNVYYNYVVTATVGGVNATVVDNKDGTYTVENVTGALVITASRTAKQFTVTFTTSTGVSLPANGTATYGTDYAFVMPVKEHYSISITSAKYEDGSTVQYANDAGTVTFTGAAVIQNITIAIDQVQADATVSVIGTGASDAVYTPYAAPGTAYTLTVNKNASYTYDVTAAVNGTELALTVNGNAYTIAASDVQIGSIVFTVNKKLPTSGISVSQYLQLDDSSLWLIRNTAAQVADSTYTYKGTAMFWSEKYNAYCILVAADTMNADDVIASDLALVPGAAVSVSYGCDVNKSGKVDANDAQLVYNMYKADYAGFDADVTMEKFLRADVNGSGSVNVDDAAAVITAILG